MVVEAPGSPANALSIPHALPVLPLRGGMVVADPGRSTRSDQMRPTHRCAPARLVTCASTCRKYAYDHIQVPD